MHGHKSEEGGEEGGEEGDEERCSLTNGLFLVQHPETGDHAQRCFISISSLAEESTR